MADSTQWQIAEKLEQEIKDITNDNGNPLFDSVAIGVNFDLESILNKSVAVINSFTYEHDVQSPIGGNAVDSTSMYSFIISVLTVALRTREAARAISNKLQKIKDYIFGQRFFTESNILFDVYIIGGDNAEDDITEDNTLYTSNILIECRHVDEQFLRSP